MSDKPDKTDPEIELYTALSNFQGEALEVPKTRTANITATRSYQYADLNDILKITQPVLKKHGLGVTQIIKTDTDGVTWLTTRLFHVHGAFIESDLVLPLGGQAKAQEIGSAVTYMRRYAYTALLGIVSDDDDDGSSASDQHQTIRPGNVLREPVKPATPTIGKTQHTQGELLPYDIKPEDRSFWMTKKLGSGENKYAAKSQIVDFLKDQFNKAFVKDLSAEEWTTFVNWFERQAE